MTKKKTERRKEWNMLFFGKRLACMSCSSIQVEKRAENHLRKKKNSLSQKRRKIPKGGRDQNKVNL